LLSYFFHIPVSIALVKLVGWFTKGGNWSQTLAANKVLLQVAHAFLYAWMDFFQSLRAVPKPFAILPSSMLSVQLHFSKESDWQFHQRAEIDQPAT
jgi:hypothetical protein